MLSVETICNLTGDDCFDHSKYGTYDMYSHFQIQSSEESEMEESDLDFFDMVSQDGWMELHDGIKMDRQGHIAGGLKLK